MLVVQDHINPTRLIKYSVVRENNVWWLRINIEYMFLQTEEGKHISLRQRPFLKLSDAINKLLESYETVKSKRYIFEYVEGINYV